MSKRLVGNEWLRKRMSELGYTSLEQVANQIGSHKGNLWRYFAFRTIPNMGLLPAMCEALECTPTELLHALQLLDRRKSLA
jgi:transcriptional regulator with XRE-family HTH domain